MPRVKRGFKARRRRNKILKLAKGNRGARGRCFKQAKETVERGLCFAFAHRKLKKRDYRSLWIARINAACRLNNISYSRFMGGLLKSNIHLNRKILSHLAISDPGAFSYLVQQAKAS